MSSRNAMPLLVDIRDSDSKLGMDIGGTLAKMVIAMPDTDDTDDTQTKAEAMQRLKRLPSYFGESGRCPPELAFNATINNKNWTLQFLRGSTHRLVPLLSKKTGAAARLKDIPVELRGPPRQVVAAGGGAHKFKDLFLSSMWIEIVALKEFQSLVDGLRFLNAHQPPEELYTVTQDQLDKSVWRETVIEDWPVPLYPFLLVSFGSGVSVLQVNSGAESDYERVGGTATGGATFLGLMNLLGKNYRKEPLSFDEAVELAASGDPRKVDKLVGDIYGEDGCANLGLPPTMTAANFGKLASVIENRERLNPQHSGSSDSVGDDGEEGEEEVEEVLPDPSLADIAAATLQMISQASAVLVRTIAQQAKCLTRVFVVGGFMDSNPIARKVFAQNLAALKGRAIFVKHSGFLGSLGSLQNCLSTGEISRHLDPLYYGWELGILGGNTAGYSGAAVREITCPTDLVTHKRSTSSNTNANPFSSAQTPLENFSLFPNALGNSDVRCGVIEERPSVCSDVSNDTVESEGVGGLNSVAFPASPVIRSVSDREREDFFAVAEDGLYRSDSDTSTNSIFGNQRMVITDPSLSDANYWWQFGMIWAFSASFAMVRDDEKVYELLKEKKLLPAHIEDEILVDDVEGGGGGGGDNGVSRTGKISGSDWRFSESIRCLDKCIQLEPRCAMAFWALSWVHGHSKTFPENKTTTSETVGGHTSLGAENAGSCHPNRLKEEEEYSQGVGEGDSVKDVLSVESAHFASRRAVGLLRAGKFTNKEEALIETNGLRFALWPPCEYARYLSLSYAAAMKSACDSFPHDPDIVTIKVRSRLDVLDANDVFSDFSVSDKDHSGKAVDHSEREKELLRKVDIALKANSNHIGLLLAAYSLLTRLVLKDRDNEDLLLRLKNVINLLVQTSPDSAALYLSPVKSWKSLGFYKSMFGLKSPSHSQSVSWDSNGSPKQVSPKSHHGSFGGNAAMGRMRGISYGVIAEN